MNSDQRASGLDEARSADETAQWFRAQLYASLNGESAGVRTYRTVHAPLISSASGQSALVAVAEASSLCAARAEIQSGRWKLQKLGQWTGLAALGRPASSEDYFACIAEHLAPFVRRTGKIGLCLPWPLETVDAVNVMRPPVGSPWHKHLDGLDPAKALQSAFARIGVSTQGSIRCVAAPIAALLAGLVLPETNLRNMAALVLDGGGQAAYVEQCRPAQPVTIVTVDLDVLADLVPVEARALGGASLQDMPSIGSVTLLRAHSACTDGYFSPAAVRHLRPVRQLPDKSLCAWLETRHTEPTVDEIVFRAIADQVFRRVARRYAASAAGILHCTAQHNSDGPAYLVMHGAAYGMSRLLRDYIADDLRTIDPSNGVPSFHCAQVRHDLLIGTACAALQHTSSDALTLAKPAAEDAG